MHECPRHVRPLTSTGRPGARCGGLGPSMPDRSPAGGGRAPRLRAHRCGSPRSRPPNIRCRRCRAYRIGDGAVIDFVGDQAGGRFEQLHGEIQLGRPCAEPETALTIAPGRPTPWTGSGSDGRWRGPDHTTFGDGGLTAKGGAMLGHLQSSGGWPAANVVESCACRAAAAGGVARVHGRRPDPIGFAADEDGPRRHYVMRRILWVGHAEGSCKSQRGSHRGSLDLHAFAPRDIVSVVDE